MLKNTDVGVLKGNIAWANLARLCTVEILPLHISTRPRFAEVYKEVGALMAEHIETKR